MTNSPSAIEYLLAKQAITEGLYRYCRVCDPADGQTLRSRFYLDFWHRHCAFEEMSSDFCIFAMNIEWPLKACKHTLTNVLIEVHGDIALNDAHYIGFQRQWGEATQTYEDYFNSRPLHRPLRNPRPPMEDCAARRPDRLGVA